MDYQKIFKIKPIKIILKKIINNNLIKFSYLTLKRTNFPIMFKRHFKELLNLKTILLFLDQYKINGTLNLSRNPCYQDPNTYPNFQNEYEKFKIILIELVNRKESKTFYKFGDGDYYTLKKLEVGSASPGRRDISKSYNEINNREFIDGVLPNDYITVEIYPRNRKFFTELFPERKIDFPTDYSYGIVANKWIFKEFKGKIGLIGAKEKLELIEKLLEYKEYQNYLGIEKFNDYIYIPQRYACDNVDDIKKSVKEQLINSTSEIFLVGIGHVKNAILHKFKEYKGAIYLDVGCGIDAIAGVIEPERPYFGGWVNYRIKSFDYSVIDFWRYTTEGKFVFL